MREGIILGAVVGPGFAALENAGYAFNALFTVEGLSLRGLVETEVLRGVLTPVGHGVWTRHPWRGAVPGGRLRAAGPHLAQITLLALVLVFGVYAIVDRVAALVAAARGRQLAGGSRGWLVLEGLLGIAAGIVALLWPGITALALLWVIAAWAVLTGVLEIVAAVRLRRVLDNEWLVVVAGILSIWAGPDWTRYSSDIVGP